MDAQGDGQQYNNDGNNKAEQLIKQPELQQTGKRRGTVGLQNSKGPPEGFYSPNISVLSVGDGDLSFSLAVSQWVLYKYKQNVKLFVATTYDTYEQLQTLYKLNVKTNISKLQHNNARVLHGIDVNKLNQPNVFYLIDPLQQKFDRVVWNFPHAGFPQKNYGPGFQWEEGFHQKHIAIIDSFFRYAKLYLKQNGLILMAHKTLQPFSIWNIEGIAQKNEYELVSKQPFNVDDYPGYENRRGAGKNGGKRFPIEDAVQYVFKQKTNKYDA